MSFQMPFKLGCLGFCYTFRLSFVANVNFVFEDFLEKAYEDLIHVIETPLKPRLLRK